jgi:hypothetical protein
LGKESEVAIPAPSPCTQERVQGRGSRTPEFRNSQHPIRKATAFPLSHAKSPAIFPGMSDWPAAVLFDFDGVLVNSEPLHFQAFREVLALDHLQLSEEEYYD